MFAVPSNRTGRHVAKYKHELLETTIECQFGLIPKLTSSYVLNEKEILAITSSRGSDLDRNCELLQVMLSKEDKEFDQCHQRFLSGLMDTTQNHLAEYIRQCGGRNRIFLALVSKEVIFSRNQIQHILRVYKCKSKKTIQFKL